MSRSYRRQRSLARRCLGFVWRCLKIFLMAFAAMGPPAPPPPLPRPDPTEQRQEKSPKLRKAR